MELLEAAAKASPVLAPTFKERVEHLNAQIRDPRHVVATDTEWAENWKELRDRTRDIFPNECVHADGEKAAVDHLYQMYDNPDIDEDYRGHIYHCRAIMDPEYRGHEILNVPTVAMWFSGKAMAPDEVIGKYCGNNEKSRITVKLAAAGGTAPSKEPRVSYDEQRALHRHMAARREEFKTLEQSELRDAAMLRARQEKRAAAMGSGPSTSSEPTLNLNGIRPIYNNATVTTTDV